MTLTRIVALFVRLGSLYCGWKLVETVIDYVHAVQVIHPEWSRNPNQEWMGYIMIDLARYTHTPNEISEAVYGQIEFWLLLWTVGLLILWIFAVPFARIITSGLERA